VRAPTSARIHPFLRLLRDRGASDLHLSVGRPPAFRIGGQLDPLRTSVLGERDYAELVEPITPEHLWERFQATGDVDFAYEVPGLARFRVNLFRHVRGAGAVLRMIPGRAPSMRQLGLPASVRKLVGLTEGLVLVTGPTASGKSTTLASLVHEINETRNVHLVTIESPIEFVHENRRAMVSQREVGVDAESFAAALRGALREDPDVILIGELEDTDTVEMALAAAEAGLLVLGTLHTSSAGKAIAEIVGAFPERQQGGARSMLSGVLRGVVAQRLVPRKGGGSVAAFEVLLGTPALATLIREGRTDPVGALIASGRAAGMVRLDDSLRELVGQELVLPEDALEMAADRDAMAKWVAARGAAAARG
jgi:twitching motility protein PilT